QCLVAAAAHSEQRPRPWRRMGWRQQRLGRRRWWRRFRRRRWLVRRRRGVGTLVMLSEAAHKRIVAAIDAIDEKSDGEVYCLIAPESSNYREVPLAWAAIVALLVPPLALLLGFNPEALLNLSQGWTAGQAALIRQEVAWALSNYAVGQAALFALT